MTRRAVSVKMAMSVKLAFHIIVAAIDIYSIYYDFLYIDSGYKGLGGKFRFLTTWCIFIQSAYFVLSVFIDVTEKAPVKGKTSQRSALCKFRDALHTSIACPVAIFGALSFWTLYTLDKELVRPKKMEGLVPFWLNHVIHTTILPFIVIDKLFIFHVYPSRLYGLLGIIAFAISYLLWMSLIAYVDNVWVYPILQKLGAQKRAMFIAACLVTFALCYLVGEILTKVIWGTPKRPTHSPRSKKN